MSRDDVLIRQLDLEGRVRQCLYYDAFKLDYRLLLTLFLLLTVLVVIVLLMRLFLLWLFGFNRNFFFSGNCKR